MLHFDGQGEFYKAWEVAPIADISRPYVGRQLCAVPPLLGHLHWFPIHESRGWYGGGVPREAGICLSVCLSVSLSVCLYVCVYVRT